MKKKSHFKLMLKVVLTLLVYLCIGKMNVEAAGTNLSTATPISLDSTISGKLTSNSQRDYYKFTISKNSIIKISMETAAHKEHCGVRLFDSEGDVISINSGDYFFFTDDDANWGYQQGSQKCGLNAGTYYIQVYKNSGPDVNYDVIVEDIVKESSTVKVAGLENNYLNSAKSFSLGDKLTSVAVKDYAGWSYNECHYYKFKVSKKQTVMFKFNTPVSDENDSVWFELLDSSGKLYRSKISVEDDPGKNNVTIKETLPAGTYYISVTSTGGYDRYTIKTACKPHSTKITSLTSKNKSITVKWDKKSNISGYLVHI